MALTDPPESLSSDSVSGGIAAAIASMAERNILQTITFNSIRENNRTSQTEHESSIEEHEMGRIGSSEEPDFDDARSRNECLSISSTSGDDSWDSFSASFQDRNQNSDGDGFNLDEDPIIELIDTDSSSSSSVHTISDVSNGSPNHSNVYESLSCSHRSGSMEAETNFGSFNNPNS